MGRMGSEQPRGEPENSTHNTLEKGRSSGVQGTEGCPGGWRCWGAVGTVVPFRAGATPKGLIKLNLENHKEELGI